ncbi:hypothetical protein [Blastopirellula marina]|uniref:SLA1 homology domain-containing protein n=1 Tax=Blastopirellula marina TaxID=124 RepID=A0A2S8G8B3_9BACT|nr:hypothetical protein [Blastopirellula marina]PQO40695.1 hypothetical protein C5Y98_05610 [Blastopirellula marina]PTL45655.1 hypothetical protein C5Y97_05610 [Blastopirellula marina]
MNVCRSLVTGWLLLFGMNTLLVAGEARTWTDISGNTMVGELLDVTSNHHALLRVDEETVSIPFSIFSKADQTFLKSKQNETQKTPQASSQPSSNEPTDQPPADTSETEKQEIDPQENAGEQKANATSPVITSDNYVPPKSKPELAYFCTNCDHELSASIGVGDHCPHCNVLLEYEEDENGTVTAGKKDIPWYWRTGIRIAATVFVAGLAGLWKMRHLIPLPSSKEPEPYEVPSDVWQKST